MQKFLIFILFGCAGLFAKSISLSDAQNVAMNWMAKKNNANFSIKQSSKKYSTPQSQNYFIVKLEPKGWVIVSGDDDFKPIIGYGLSSSDGNIPEALQAWLDQISSSMQKAKKSTSKNKNTLIKNQWKNLKNSPKLYSNKINRSQNDNNYVVYPLLWLNAGYEGSGINLNQDDPYNKYCPPFDSTPKSYAGCVATAITQIMTYHKYPNHATGSHSYTHNVYGEISKDFSQSYYDWTNMAINGSSSSLALDNTAKITYDVAVSVDMDFSLSGSGAYDYDAYKALNNYFYYKADYKQRNDYSDSKWHEILQNELKHSRPVYYSGQGSGGHAFLMDGYDKDKFYHFNFGWSGYFNGKFTIDSIITQNGGNFSYEQSLISMIPYNKYIVQFADKNLQQCIKDNIYLYISPMPVNLGAVTADDTLSITNLDCSNRGILDVSGLDILKNLVSIDLTSNHIMDFSPIESLSGLTIIGKESQTIYPDKYEPNDSFDTAKEIKNGTFDLSFKENDNDYFTFTMPYEANATFETSGTSGDTVLELYDANKSSLKDDDDGGLNNFSKISTTLGKGKYYLQIKEYYENSLIHYKLKADFPSNTNMSPVYYLLLN